MGYLANFMVYVLAMVGVIVVALLVFKNATFQGGVKKSKYLKVIDTMSIAPRKTLYIVSAGNEKFLIAGDVDKTSLISKLESKTEEVTEISVNQTERVPQSFSETMSSLNKKTSYMDKSNIGITSSSLNRKGISDTGYTSVIRNLAERMK